MLASFVQNVWKLVKKWLLVLFVWCQFHIFLLFQLKQQSDYTLLDFIQWKSQLTEGEMTQDVKNALTSARAYLCYENWYRETLTFEFMNFGLWAENNKYAIE